MTWHLREFWDLLKRGIGEATLKQIFEYGETNKLCLEDSIVKLIELDKFKPKIKQTLSVLTKMIEKMEK